VRAAVGVVKDDVDDVPVGVDRDTPTDAEHVAD
jgi:hypothetical protein